MNAYRWFLVILTVILGIGNVFFLDKEDLSLFNNFYEYLFMILMFGASVILVTQRYYKNEDNKPLNQN